MIRTRLILIVAFLLVFAAGASVGLLLDQKTTADNQKPGAEPQTRPGGERDRGGAWLTQELGLSNDQREQMRKIWSDVMTAGFRTDGEQRKVHSQKRDEDIRALLTAEQQAKYDAILQDYARHLEELSQQRKTRFDDAVARTKAILSPEQSAKYDKLLKQWPHGPGGPGGFRGSSRHRGSEPAATTSTKPTSGPSAPRVEE